MTNILYRSSSTPTVPSSTTAKGGQLNNAEIDGNFKSISDDIDLRATIANPTFTGTVGGVTKSMVGLGNVDNTADVNKPVSTAQSTAITNAVAADIVNQGYTRIVRAAAGATIDWNMNLGSVLAVTLNSAAVVNAPTNMRVGMYVLEIKNDTTPRALTWNAIYKFPFDIYPDTSVANSYNLVTMFYNGTHMRCTTVPYAS